MTRIETEEQYIWAVKRVEELFPLIEEDTPRSDPKLIELDIISGLVSDYEAVHYPIGEPILADIIKLRMCEMDLSEEALSKLLKIPYSRICEVLSGKKEPTLRQARTISKKLNIDPAIVLGV